LIRQVDEEGVERAYFVLNFLIILCWAVILGYLAYATITSYRLVRRPLHKNRLFYWALSLCFIGFADLMVFLQYYPFSGAFRLLGLLLLAYVVLFHNLADLFQAGLQTLRYLVITLVSVVVYAAVILIPHVLTSIILLLLH
jgi:hypothetical protein